MDFEQNAVESDYDEEYDSKTVVMSRGRATFQSQEEDEKYIQPACHYIPEYKPAEESVRRRGPVQLPLNKEVSENAQPDKEDKPIYNFPKGGWKVQSIPTTQMTDLFRVDAEISEKKASRVDAAPEKTSLPRLRAPRWKDITTDVFSESTPPIDTEESFTETKKQRSIPKLEVQKTPEISDEDRRKNTKFCRFVEIKVVNGKTTEVNKCRSATCSYAHSIESYNPPCCRFQDNCRNMSTCAFKHRNETKESYHERSSRLVRHAKV